MMLMENKISYDNVLLFHETLKAKFSLGEPSQYLAAAMASDRSRGRIIKLSRRLGMLPEEVFKAFPTWEKLEEMNIYDPHRVRYDNDQANFLDSIFFV